MAPAAASNTNSTSTSKWVNWVNVLLKEMDNNFILFNVNDIFRLTDSIIDKAKTLVVMNWNQKSIKIMVQILYSFVEDEPANVSVYKVKMLKSGAS